MIDLIHDDCMNVMAKYPDKYFDLAIVDPPYGIGSIKGKEQKDGCTHGKNWKRYERKGWDNDRPSSEYFNELFRITKHQIVWGANYFTQHLPPSMGWVFWDKGQDLTMSDGELAFSSFERALRRIVINRCKISEQGGLLHPTQKPVKLYKWLLKTYGKPNDKILDTHLGSGSIAIACHDMDFDLVGVEIDEEYYKAALKRFKAETRQLKLMLMEDTATINRMRYMKPPTIDAIDEFRHELRISERQFERFYGIPFLTISKVRAGDRELPAKFWKIVYEKIQPAYGIGFLHEAIANQKEAKNSIMAKIKTVQEPEMDNHNRLGRLKTK